MIAKAILNGTKEKIKIKSIEGKFSLHKEKNNLSFNSLDSYLAEDDEGRPVMLTYLDGKPKEKAEKQLKADYNTFVTD